MTKMRDSLIRKVLENWSQLNKTKNKLTEDECEFALNYEIEHHKRRMFVISLHQRFCTLRKNRERRELIAQCK